jgi:hypothetical protein
VAGVEAERDGGTVFGTKAAVRAEDKDFGVEYVARVPTHANVLAEAEEVAGGLGEEHLGRDGKDAGGAGGVGGDSSEVELGGLEYGGEGDFRNDECSWFQKD